jgi:hypothetical protein
MAASCRIVLTGDAPARHELDDQLQLVDTVAAVLVAP